MATIYGTRAAVHLQWGCQGQLVASQMHLSIWKAYFVAFEKTDGHAHPWTCMGLHTAHRWIVARPNCHCWPSVKSTKKISSSSITCLVLMSYCTSWWRSFDRSAYGIIESSDFIVETVFPLHHQSVQSHACSTQREQFDQWLDYKSCWQISSRGCWYISTSLPQPDCDQMHSGHGEDLVLFAAFCGWIFLARNFSRCQFRLKHTLSSLADSDCSLLPIWSERNIEMAFMASADKCTGY